MSGLQRLDVHTRQSFVRPAVKEVPLTTAIIDAIMPYFPKDCILIAGYLDDGDQYWKVNFHWDLLVSMIDKSLTKGMSEAHQKAAKAVRQVLLTNPPNPTTGYKDSATVGLPVDSSDRATIKKRWATIKQSKKDFKVVVEKAGLLENPPPAAEAWHLAVAPLAAPGTSKHGSGYAVDIGTSAGGNAKIREISSLLGASLVFDEQSHVHVEFAKGVKVPGYRPPGSGKSLAPSEVEPKGAPLPPREKSDLQDAGTKGTLQDVLQFPQQLLKDFLEHVL
jgi:hypothetical protein